jgi:hypothetical protein
MNPRMALRAVSLAITLAWALAAFVPGAGARAADPATVTFETPAVAMNAFGNAVANSDEAALKAMLGEQFRQLIPPIGAEGRERFLHAWSELHVVKNIDDKLARIEVGTDGWSLPIPLVKSDAGWRFDTQAGVEEIRVRRIGRNELAVIQTLLAVYDAQRDYASEDRDGDGLRKYAMKLKSSPGKHDGLYWPTRADERPSPIGPALAAASGRGTSPEGYHGYHYKLLTQQGVNAAGGPYSYLVRGKLLGGFAVVAWPVRYGDTGVMSFMVNHDGQVYERDLGRDSAKKAAATKSFDPGPGWRRVSP